MRFFGNTYVGSFMPMKTNVITTKTQGNAENACVNRMWQLGPFEELKIETSVVVENIFFSTSGRNVEQRVVVN